MDRVPAFISAFHEYTTYEHHVPAPLFRHTFELESVSEDATLLISGLGFYEVWINGENITKGPLAPYISNPDDIVYFDEYEIGKYLRKGKNVIAAILGNGMQNCPGGQVWDFEKAKFRGVPRLAFELSLTNEDGGEAFVTAGTDTRVAASAITFDDLRSGEFYDARLELDGWTLPDFDDSGWANAYFTEQPRGEARICAADTVSRVREIKPVAVFPGELIPHDPHGRFEDTVPQYIPPEKESGYIYDFGENISGVCRLKIDGEPGQEIVLQFGELLTDGKLDNRTINFYPAGYSQRDIYICKGGSAVYEPKFTYHGFRYCLVTGVTEKQATAELLTCVVINSALADRGAFECSDEIANKIQEITRRSDLANFVWFPTDCPHREKNGWTGDASISSEHVTLNFAPEKSYAEWLRSIRAAQALDGSLPGIVPTGGWGFEWGNGPAWDSVLTNLPYVTYRYRGDTSVLKENASAIFRYLDYISTRIDERGLICIGLGDWCPVGRGAGDYKVPLEFTDSVITMDTAEKAAVIFDALGRTAQAEFARALAAGLKKAVRKNLIDFNTMTVLGSSQTGQAMGIFYNIFEQGEKQAALARLVGYIRDNGGAMDVGFLGGRTIFHVLADGGFINLAYDMITREDYPSYGNWIKRGATSLWESFMPTERQSGSLNHHFWGDVSNFFISKIAGIRINPRMQGAATADVCPNFVSKLEYACAHYDTVKGRLEVDWKRDGREIVLTVSAPAGLKGYVRLPEDWHFVSENSNWLDGMGYDKMRAGKTEYRISQD